MTAAVLASSIMVSLLCVYVYAYAKVTTVNYQLVSLRRELKKAQQDEAVLNAEISRLSLRTSVGDRARALGMELAGPEATQVITVKPVAMPQMAASSSRTSTGGGG